MERDVQLGGTVGVIGCLGGRALEIKQSIPFVFGPPFCSKTCAFNFDAYTDLVHFLVGDGIASQKQSHALSNRLLIDRDNSIAISDAFDESFRVKRSHSFANDGSRNAELFAQFAL